MDNAADRKSIRRKEKAARLADVQRREVISEVMSTINGRQWIWELLSSAHIFTTTFTADPYASAFQEGQRAMGLALLADIMIHCPDAYIQAQRESNERYLSNDRSPDDPSSAGTNPASERRSSPLSDGGDLGAVADSEAPGSETSDSAGWDIPGSDIYVERPKV